MYLLKKVVLNLIRAIKILKYAILYVKDIERKSTKFDHQLNKDVTFYERILPTDYKSLEHLGII